MKSQEQLDKEMPSRVLTVISMVVGGIHFVQSSGHADAVLLGLFVLAAIPWMGTVFESIGKDGAKFRTLQGEESSPPALSSAQHAMPSLNQTRIQPSAFSELTRPEKKVLATLWKYQKIHFPSDRVQRWTFV